MDINAITGELVSSKANEISKGVRSRVDPSANKNVSGGNSQKVVAITTPNVTNPKENNQGRG